LGPILACKARGDLLASKTFQTTFLRTGRLDGVEELLGRVLAVTLGVVADPFPEVLAGLLHGELCLPLELLVGEGGVGGQVEDVAVAAGVDLVGEVAADDGAEGLDDLEDGAAAAGTEVPGLQTGLVLSEVLEGDKMAAGEIKDVDVIADGSAVVGGVVCTILVYLLN
jgi:hypothetical protein